MRWTKNLFRHFRAFSRIEIFNCEIETEINFHIEMRTQENIELGMLPKTAKQDALERFGDIEHFKTLCRKARQESKTRNLFKVINLFTLPLAAIGLAISLMDINQHIHKVGHLFVVIAVLLRLFLYVKKSYLKSGNAFSARGEKILFNDVAINRMTIEE